MNKRILARQRQHRERSEDLRSEYGWGSRGAGQLVTDAGAGGAREPHVGREQGEHWALGSAIASLLTTGAPGGPGHLIRPRGGQVSLDLVHPQVLARGRRDDGD